MIIKVDAYIGIEDFIPLTWRTDTHLIISQTTSHRALIFEAQEADIEIYTAIDLSGKSRLLCAESEKAFGSLSINLGDGRAALFETWDAPEVRRTSCAVALKGGTGWVAWDFANGNFSLEGDVWFMRLTPQGISSVRLKFSADLHEKLKGPNGEMPKSRFAW